MTTRIIVADCRDAILCELNPEYAEIARARLNEDAPMLLTVSIEQGRIAT